jgi:hypothetical protein
LPGWTIEIEILVVLEGFGLADWSISGDVKAPMGSSSKTTNLLCFMFYEDQTIKKWCNKQIEARVQLEDELVTQDSDESVVFNGNEVDEEWVCCDDSEEVEDYNKSEVCMVVADKVEEEELETEGPHKQLGRLNSVFKTFIGHVG